MANLAQIAGSYSLLQYFLLSIEVVILIAFAVFALIRVYSGTAESYSLVPTLTGSIHSLSTSQR